jgi:hypothetical protein
MPGFTRLDLLLQSVAFGTAGDVNKGGQPVEGREQLILDRPWLDMPRPTDHHRAAVPAFPGLAFLTLERGHTTVGKRNRLGAIVAREGDDRVVKLAHVFQLLEHDANIVVELLHAGFVDPPVLAAPFAQHCLVFRRQHGGDVHARRVVPDEEGLIGLLGIIAIEEVDDLR